MGLPSDSAPLFITAKTPAKLRTKMIRLNLEHSAKLRFFSIYFDGENHIAWYYPPVYHGGDVI